MSPKPRSRFQAAVLERFVASKVYQVGRHRDFRLMWTGAFLSFVGSWVQNVAQGYLVWKLTGDHLQLALVSVCSALPITLIGPIAGTLADAFDKRKLLVVTQSIFAAGALYLAAATHFGFVRYWQILVVALILGTVGAVEIPTRQAIVSKVVPPEDLQAAIPINGMTFNLARLVGPVIGGMLLQFIGPDACYLLNGLSFFALIFAGLAIRADLKPMPREPQPVLDLIFEGFLYTWRERRLRTIFLLECSVSVFGLFYLSQMAAIADQIGLGKRLGNAFFAVGVGAVAALITVTWLSHRPIKATLLRVAVTLMGVMIILMSFTTSEWLAYPLFALLGMGSITIFNTCNQLFQTLSPERLRGRVLSMHIWALSGISPFGLLAFGLVAQRYGLPLSLQISGSIVVLTAVAAWCARKSFAGMDEPMRT